MTADTAIRTRLVRGGAWTLSGHAVALLASLVATPFVIRQLGVEAYGVLALVNLLIGQLAFADVGMSEASTRFAAGAYQRGDEAGEAAVIWATLLIALVPSALGALLLALAARPLVEGVFHVPDSLSSASIAALQIAAVGFAARAMAGVLNTPQLVRLRLDLYTLINSGAGTLQIALIPLVLLAGGGLTGAVWVITGAACATAVAHAVVASRLLPALTTPRWRPDLLMPIARFGGAVATSSLVNIALANGEKLMLTWFASVGVLAHYSVAFTFASLLATAPIALGQGLMPAFARLGSLADRAPLRALYRYAVRATLLCSPPTVLLLCVAARPFFSMWAGPEFGRESTPAFYVLAVALVFNVTSVTPYKLLTALGRAGFIARYHALELIPYFVCAGVLTYAFGSVGAATAWALRQMVGTAAFLVAARRLEGVVADPLPAHRRAYIAALSALVVPIAIAFFTLSAFGVQMSIALASTAAYAHIVWRRVLTDDERGWTRRTLRMAPRLPAILDGTLAS